MKRIYRFASIAAAATLMVVGGCEEDELEQKAPADAGAISGATENVCPDTVVALSVKAITGATGYVWYRDGEEVAETDLLDLATGTTSYTATTSGAYAVAGKNDVGVGKKSATVTVTITECAPPDAPPAAAGDISGETVNICPSRTVTLSVAPVTGATSYLWLIAYAADDVDSVRTAKPTDTIDISTLVDGQEISITVSGVNNLGTGAASPAYKVTRVLCPVGQPAIAGNNEWKTTRGDTAVYTIVCPATIMSATATTETEDSIYRYQWYRQLVGTDTELAAWTTDGSATLDLGGRGYTYNYAVAAITADGEGPKSKVIQVIAPLCPTPDKPGGNTGNVALFPEQAYPTGTDYSFSISNCDIQEKTYQAETSVTLVANAATLTVETERRATGYAFWVKTPGVDTFRNVLETGIEATARKIVVDGTTYPSGTYRVTAFNANGHSDFGNNEITVNIRTDCPEPPTLLPAPTFQNRAGDPIADGSTFTNTCPDETATLYVSAGGSAASAIKWKKGAGEYVTWESTNSIKLSAADNGTYTVIYTKEADGVSSESAEATIVISMTICPPTFASKQSVIVEPATYAEVVLNAPDASLSSLITGYEWFFNDGVTTEEDVVVGATPLTFHLLKVGTYKVRAKQVRGVSAFSEEITITKVTAPDAFTRDELLGTYSVADWRGANAATALNYTLTIEADTHADSIIITNLANVVGTGSYPIKLKAAVSFTSDAKTNGGNYGTISIPKQAYDIPSWTYNFRHVTNDANPAQFDDADVVLDIKFIDGKPGVSQIGLRYLLTRGTATAINNVYGGGATKTTTWTKQ